MTNRSKQTSGNWNETRVSSVLGIRYPIIQGPLGGLSTQRLAATVSNFGGLGSFGAHGLSPSSISEVIGQIRSLTAKPFAINLWVSMEDQGARTSNSAAFSRSLAPLAGHIQRLGGALPEHKAYTPTSFEDQVRVLLDEEVPVFSFIFGIPPKDILEDCHTKGIITIGTATTPEEAISLEQAGVDLIVASGFEAGGHRGSFLLSGEDSLMGTFSLLPQAADSVSIPVIGAGGIADARGVLAALTLGAEGVQIGTAFLASEESGASATHRNALLAGGVKRTSLTRGFTGRLARGIHNQLMAELTQKEVSILPYPLQRLLVKNLTTLAEREQLPELLQLWAGQSVNLIKPLSAEVFLETLVSELK